MDFWWSVYSSSTSFFLDQVYADFLDFNAAPLQAIAADYTIGTKTLARGYTSVNFYGKLVYNPIGAGCFARFEFPHLLQTSNIYDPRDVAVLRRLVEERTDSLEFMVVKMRYLGILHLLVMTFLSQILSQNY